jgi:hypothetical protein
MSLDNSKIETRAKSITLDTPFLAPTLAMNGKAVSPIVHHNCHGSIADANRVICNHIDRIKSADPQAKIILLYGEEHATSSHVLLPVGAMKHCLNKAITVEHGDEISHNRMVTIAKEVFGYEDITNDDLALFTQVMDDNGGDLLRSSIATSLSPFARFSNEAKWQFCLNHYIGTQFTDAAYIDKNDHSFLDYTDQATLKVISNYAKKMYRWVVLMLGQLRA